VTCSGAFSSCVQQATRSSWGRRLKADGGDYGSLAIRASPASTRWQNRRGDTQSSAHRSGRHARYRLRGRQFLLTREESHAAVPRNAQFQQTVVHKPWCNRQRQFGLILY